MCFIECDSDFSQTFYNCSNVEEILNNWPLCYRELVNCIELEKAVARNIYSSFICKTAYLNLGPSAHKSNKIYLKFYFVIFHHIL